MKSVKSFPLSLLLVFGIALAFSQWAPAQKKKPVPKPKAEKSSIVERIGSTGILQLEAESFKALSPRQKILSYYLSEASIAVDPIIYDQLSRFGLRQKRILEAVVSHPRDVRPGVLRKIDDYTKLFWANNGNHNGNTAQKFLPEFTYEELEAAGLQAIKNGGLLMPAAEFRKSWASCGSRSSIQISSRCRPPRVPRAASTSCKPAPTISTVAFRSPTLKTSRKGIL